LFIAEDAELIRLLAGKARAGTTVRIALGDPDSPHVDQRGRDEASTTRWPPRSATPSCYYRPLARPARRSDCTPTVLYNSLYVGDDEMLINHTSTVSPPPTPHAPPAPRSGDDGIFATYTDSFEPRLGTGAPLGPVARADVSRTFPRLGARPAVSSSHGSDVLPTGPPSPCASTHEATDHTAHPTTLRSNSSSS
jgi:hypothetical protein